MPEESRKYYVIDVCHTDTRDGKQVDYSNSVAFVLDTSKGVNLKLAALNDYYKERDLAGDPIPEFSARSCQELKPDQLIRAKLETMHIIRGFRNECDCHFCDWNRSIRVTWDFVFYDWDKMKKAIDTQLAGLAESGAASPIGKVQTTAHTYTVGHLAGGFGVSEQTVRRYRDAIAEKGETIGKAATGKRNHRLTHSEAIMIGEAIVAGNGSVAQNEPIKELVRQMKAGNPLPMKNQQQTAKKPTNQQHTSTPKKAL